MQRGKQRHEELEGDRDLGSERRLGGAEQDVDDLLADDDEGCGPPVFDDIIDDALEGVINLLIAAGYDEQDSEDAVYSALESLHAADQMADTPDLDEPEEAKTAWIFNNIPRVKSKLREMGLDFEEG